jgi:hypothetical protein
VRAVGAAALWENRHLAHQRAEMIDAPSRQLTLFRRLSSAAAAATAEANNVRVRTHTAGLAN